MSGTPRISALHTKSRGCCSSIRKVAHQVLSREECVILKDIIKAYRTSSTIPQLCSALKQIINNEDKLKLLVEMEWMLPSEKRSDFVQICDLYFPGYQQISQLSAKKRHNENWSSHYDLNRVEQSFKSARSSTLRVKPTHSRNEKLLEELVSTRQEDENTSDYLRPAKSSDVLPRLSVATFRKHRESLVLPLGTEAQQELNSPTVQSDQFLSPNSKKSLSVGGHRGKRRASEYTISANTNRVSPSSATENDDVLARFQSQAFRHRPSLSALMDVGFWKSNSSSTPSASKSNDDNKRSCNPSIVILPSSPEIENVEHYQQSFEACTNSDDREPMERNNMYKNEIHQVKGFRAVSSGAFALNGSVCNSLQEHFNEYLRQLQIELNKIKGSQIVSSEVERLEHPDMQKHFKIFLRQLRASFSVSSAEQNKKRPTESSFAEVIAESFGKKTVDDLPKNSQREISSAIDQTSLLNMNDFKSLSSINEADHESINEIGHESINEIGHQSGGNTSSTSHVRKLSHQNSVNEGIESPNLEVVGESFDDMASQFAEANIVIEKPPHEFLQNCSQLKLSSDLDDCESQSLPLSSSSSINAEVDEPASCCPKIPTSVVNNMTSSGTKNIHCKSHKTDMESKNGGQMNTSFEWWKKAFLSEQCANCCSKNGKKYEHETQTEWLFSSDPEMLPERNAQMIKNMTEFKKMKSLDKNCQTFFYYDDDSMKTLRRDEGSQTDSIESHPDSASISSSFEYDHYNSANFAPSISRTNSSETMLKNAFTPQQPFQIVPAYLPLVHQLYNTVTPSNNMPVGFILLPSSTVATDYSSQAGFEWSANFSNWLSSQMSKYQSLSDWSRSSATKADSQVGITQFEETRLLKLQPDGNGSYGFGISNIENQPTTEGSCIATVTVGGPAYCNGLKPGDRIIRVGNVDTRFMDAHAVGQLIRNAGNDLLLQIVPSSCEK